MAVAWTTIANSAVSAGAPLTTSLVTSLRDNPEGIAQRATGAPKIFGVPYNVQIFTANGTWTKPANAETGDRVAVLIIAGGGSGEKGDGSNAAEGGFGASAQMLWFDDIDDLGATEAIVIGAGGAGINASGTLTAGNDGGNSSFGTVDTDNYIIANGGEGGGGTDGTSDGRVQRGRRTAVFADSGAVGFDRQNAPGQAGGAGTVHPDEQSSSNNRNQYTIAGAGVSQNATGTGVGDAASDDEVGHFRYSNWGGYKGGSAARNADAEAGESGCGGGAVQEDPTGTTYSSGAGGNGRIVVYCIKET